MTSKEKKSIEKKLEQSRKYSIKDGIFSTIKVSLGNSYIVPFAVAINASNSLIALLSSIPSLLNPISQLFSSRLIEKYKRKKITIAAVLLEILLWIPIILTAFLFYKGIIVSKLPLLLLIFFSLSIAASGIAGPAWFSWIGDLINEKK